MYFFVAFASLLAITASLRIASALGINCQGSSICWWTHSQTVPIAARLHQAVFASEIDPSAVYDDHEHVTCIRFPNKNRDGFCLFPQGASLTLATIRPLFDALLAHNCHVCGSVPIHFVDEGSNDPRSGILTINYVDNAECTGKCIPATGEIGAKLKVRGGQRSDALEAVQS